MTTTELIQSAATRESSVLAQLRTLVPQRDLSPSEALRIAELQANRLLQHFQIISDRVPEEIVTELPRIRIEQRGPGQLGARIVQGPAVRSRGFAAGPVAHRRLPLRHVDRRLRRR